MIGREKSEVVNDEIVEFRKSDDPMEVVDKANIELDRQMRVSRHVEERELENALRSVSRHGSRMKELLLQVFNPEDPGTAAPRTADRWILLPRYWIRMHHEWRDGYFHPDDAPSPVDGLLSDCLWGDRCTVFFTDHRLTLAIRMNGLTSRCLMVLSRNVRTPEVLLVTSGLDIHCLFRLIGRLLTRMPSSRQLTRMP